MAKKKRRESITHQIMNTVVAIQNEKTPHDLSRKQYIRNTKKFILFCRQRFNCKTFEECKNHIQDYSDFLQQQDYTPSTIHNYLAAVCSTFSVGMSEISKPIRKTAAFVRGRKSLDAPSVKQDLNDPKWQRIVEFQKRVGVRRAELGRIRKEDFVQDESGKWCVFVRKGKGNKPQLQRLNSDADVEFIRRYFDQAQPGQLIFTPEELNNDLNFHALRAESAKEFYNIHLQKLMNEPDYAEEMIREIEKRWNQYNINPKTDKPKHLNPHELEGWYVLRGENRRKAIREERPIRYKKLICLYTSIF